MVKGKKLDKDKKVVEIVVRVKKYRFELQLLSFPVQRRKQKQQKDYR